MSSSTNGCQSFPNNPVITCVNCKFVLVVWKINISNSFNLSVPRPCQQFQTNLNYLSFRYDTTQYSYFYQVVLCFNNIYGQVCGNGFTDHEATLICQYNGFQGKWLNQQITLVSSFIYLFIHLFIISSFNYLSFSFIVGFVTSQYVNQTYNYYNYYYSNFTCPPSAVNLTSCSNNVNTVSSCSGYGGPAVIQCVTCKLIYNIYQFICLVYFDFL